MKQADQRTVHGPVLNILFFLALLVFIVIALYVWVYPDNHFDSFIQKQTYALGAPSLLPFWTRLTFLGSFEFLFPAYLVLILIITRESKPRFGLSIAGLAMGGFLSVQVFKVLCHRHRPPAPLMPNVVDYSFPSGHSCSSLIFCAVLVWSVWHSSIPRSLRVAAVILLTVLTGCIGLSRIILNLHYATDVAAGFCLAIVWIVAWHWFIHRNKISALFSDTR